VGALKFASCIVFSAATEHAREVAWRFCSPGCIFPLLPCFLFSLPLLLHALFFLCFRSTVFAGKRVQHDGPPARTWGVEGGGGESRYRPDGRQGCGVGFVFFVWLAVGGFAIRDSRPTSHVHVTAPCASLTRDTPVYACHAGHPSKIMYGYNEGAVVLDEVFRMICCREMWSVTSYSLMHPGP